MKAKDIRPGVVYGYRAGADDRVKPVVFLAPVDADHLYQTTSHHRKPGTVAYVKAHRGAKLGNSRLLSSSPTVGYPAAQPSRTSREKATPFDLGCVTLEDFEAATSHVAPMLGVEFTLVTSLTHVRGLYETELAAEQRRADADAAAERKAREAEARVRAIAGVLKRHGLAGVTVDTYGRPRLVITLEDAEKLLTLLPEKEN
jgi:hypothetical protein